jgi:hypothetical protein
MKNRTKKNKSKNKSTRFKKGGKVIGSGGYGCIFSPALKCQDIDNINHNTNKSEKISKLMTNRHTKDEYQEIMNFKPFIEKIPNYEDYFIMNDINICKPDKLSKMDLENYDKKCDTLTKDGVTSENINKSLNKVMALNMPNGGIDVGDYVDKIKSQSQLVNLNNSLISLLTNAIIPMNKMNIYHCDIKESNILVSEKNKKLNTRLIDWGLSTTYNMDNDIPKSMYSRPFQYNVPFSVILFNNIFDDMYKNFLKENPEPDYYDIRAFVVDYIFVWNDTRGQGHIKAINFIFSKLFENNLQHIDSDDKKLIIELDFTYYYIIEYLTKILVEYTDVKGKKINLMDYFNNVFLKIIDVWGLVMAYSPFIEYFQKEHDEPIFKAIKNIFMKYLYEARLEPIDIESLVKDLKSLNPLLENKVKKNTSLKSYSKTSNKKSKSIKSNSKSKLNSSIVKKYKTLSNGDINVKLISMTNKNKITSSLTSITLEDTKKKSTQKEEGEITQ